MTRRITARKARFIAILAIMVFGSLSLLTACGSEGGGNTPPQNQNVYECENDKSLIVNGKGLSSDAVVCGRDVYDGGIEVGESLQAYSTEQGSHVIDASLVYSCQKIQSGQTSFTDTDGLVYQIGWTYGVCTEQQPTQGGDMITLLVLHSATVGLQGTRYDYYSLDGSSGRVASAGFLQENGNRVKNRAINFKFDDSGQLVGTAA